MLAALQSFFESFVKQGPKALTGIAVATIAVPEDRGAFMGKRKLRLKIGFGTWFTRTWLP